MQRHFLVLFPILLSGCGLPPAVMIASYAADGISYVATGKSVSDHGISAVTGRDCAVWRIIKGKAICTDQPEKRADPAPVEDGQQATAPPDAPLPGAVVGGGPERHRFLVLGSFANRANAERIAGELSDGKVAIVAANVDGRITHRVIAGPLSKAEVAELRQRFAEPDRAPAWEIASLPPGM
jgi:hypothetical protein